MKDTQKLQGDVTISELDRGQATRLTTLADLLESLRCRYSTRTTASPGSHDLIHVRTSQVPGKQIATSDSLRRSQSGTSSNYVAVDQTRLESFKKLLADPIVELKKLKETDGIEDYHEKFEVLSTRVHQSEAYLVSLFLAGLWTETRMNIQMFKPHTVRHCLLVGRLYERVHPRKLVNTERVKETAKANAFIQVTENSSGVMEEASSIPAVEEVMEIVDTIVDLSEESELRQNQVGFIKKSEEVPPTSLLETEDEVELDEDNISQETDQQNTGELLQMKEGSGNVLHIQGIDVVNASALAKQTELKPADHMLFTMSEVLVHPTSQLQHPWRSKETTIFSLFQAEKDLALANIETAEEIGSKMGGEDQFRLQEILAEEKIPEEVVNENPTPGIFTHQLEYPEVEVTELTFSNGMQVCYNSTDFLDNQVLFTGFAYGGGLSELSENYYISCLMKSTIAGGIGMFGYQISEVKAQFMQFPLLQHQQKKQKSFKTYMFKYKLTLDCSKATIYSQFSASSRVQRIWDPGGFNSRILCY